jgi:hypothetical protein
MLSNSKVFYRPFELTRQLNTYYMHYTHPVHRSAFFLSNKKEYGKKPSWLEVLTGVAKTQIKANRTNEQVENAVEKVAKTMVALLLIVEIGFLLPLLG